MRLWVDTNSARSVTDLRALCSLARTKGVELAIHPQVYLERRRQRQAECKKDGSQFEEDRFDGFLRQHGIVVPSFVLDRTTAARWADQLHDRFPSDDAWHAAKKATIGGELREAFKVPPSKMPMTTDWLVALAVESDPSWFIITLDTGEEWRALREMQPPRVLTLDDACAWLKRLPDDPATS